MPMLRWLMHVPVVPRHFCARNAVSSEHNSIVREISAKHLAGFALVLLGITLIVMLSPVIESPTRLQQTSIYPLPDIELHEIRGVNYVRTTFDDPAICPDLHYGQDAQCPWNMAHINADLDRLQAHNVNTLRLFLNYYVFGAASLTNPDYTMDVALAHLDELIDAANQRGMYVMPILMAKYPQDRFGSSYYEQVLDVHVRPVVRHLAGREGVIAWDLFNEIDIGSPIDQRCWDWSNADFPLCFQLAQERIAFVHAIGQEVRRLDPGVPVTAGLAFAKNHFEPQGTDMHIADLVDFFSFHYYDNEPYDSGRYAAHWYYGEGFPADLDRAIEELRAHDPKKPIVLTELGFPSGSDTTRNLDHLRRDLAIAFWVVHHQHESGIMLWPFQTYPEDYIGDLFLPFRSSHVSSTFEHIQE